MRRRVVLVALDWARPGDPRTGLGVASISSALRAAGVEVTLISDAVNRLGFDESAISKRILAAIGPSSSDVLVGLSAFVWNEPETVRLLRRVRAETEAMIVVGGPQVSYVERGGLERLYPEADSFVRGHGELAMVALATSGPTEGVGIHFAGAEDFGLRADLDLTALPSPYLDGTIPIGQSVRWETQRGCPFACSFCQHRAPGARLRYGTLSTDRVAAEALAFTDAEVERASVLDPIFNTNRSRAVALLNMFSSVGLRARLSLQCRFELCDDAFLDALSGLDVELEFGLQTTSPEEGLAIGRPNDLRRASAVIETLHQRNIPFEVSLIYGLPEQTLDSFRRSVDWCRARRVPRLRAWPLMLLRGTPLHAERERWALVESEQGRIPIVVQSASFTGEEHAAMAEIAASLADDRA